MNKERAVVAIISVFTAIGLLAGQAALDLFVHLPVWALVLLSIVIGYIFGSLLDRQP